LGIISAMATARDAQPDDALVCASIHVASWKAAYREMLPDEYLDRLSVADRLPAWEGWLSDGSSSAHTMVVEGGGGAVLGFATIRPTDDKGVAELAGIYLDPRAWGQGFGRTLLDAFVVRARRDSYQEAVLWVHPLNERARRFYKLAGWVDDGVDRHEMVWGLEVPERRYRIRL
jgi:RimJ/RimL family protein N-acetyltransferase